VLARAIGRRNSTRSGTTRESRSGHSLFGSFFLNAVHCASVDAFQVLERVVEPAEEVEVLGRARVILETGLHRRREVRDVLDGHCIASR
jgi:hypothetical protein